MLLWSPIKVMNERALLGLSVLLAIGSGRSGKQLLNEVPEKLRSLHARGPMPAALAAVASAAMAYYAAERSRNPKLSSLYDALLYASAKVSGGSAGGEPVTPAGKLIASALMTLGPALAAEALRAPAASAAKPVAGDPAALDQVVQKLELILQELRTRRVVLGS